MSIKLNPLSGQFDFAQDPIAIPERTSDPVNPYPGQPWVLVTIADPRIVEVYCFFGALPLTFEGPEKDYNLSIKLSDGIKRVALT